jgi:hypothetical protein
MFGERRTMMEPEEDVWFWVAVAVAVVAMVAGAFTSVTGIGGEWVPWTAAIIFVGAIGSLGVRAWIRSRGIVWTEEMKEAQRRRAKQRARESISLLVWAGGMLVLRWLVDNRLLPQPVGAIGFLVLFAWFLWYEFIRRRSKRVQR